MAAMQTALPEIGDISVEQAKRVLDVARMLTVTTDLDALLTHIAESACELLGTERASIFLHDSKCNELWTRIALGASEIRVPTTAGIVGAAFTSNEILLVPRPYEDPRFNREPDRKSGFVTRNILAAPMVNFDRKPLGVIQAINKRDRDFDSTDMTLIQLLADQAGVAIQRYRLQEEAERAVAMRHEMDLARKVQEAMLPREVPDIPGIQAMGWTRSASVTGGDCFDYWKTGDGRLAILLADASGHGLAPTLVVSQVRTLIRAFCDIDRNPRKLIDRANARLSADLEADRFITAFIGFLSPDGTLEWASAGHGPILLRCNSRQKVQELVPTDLPLGVMPDLMGDDAPPVQLTSGGSLTIVSDGIFEAMDPAGAQLGMDRVIAHLDSHCESEPRKVIETLRDITTRWQQQDEPKDDQTIVVVRRV